MKKIFFTCLFICSSFYCFSQIEVKKEEFPDYQGVVTVEGKAMDDIYSNIKAWIAMNFKSANDVIQLDDKDNGKLIVKGNVVVYFTALKKKYPARVNFTLSVDVRENRFRYTYLVTDVKDESGQGSPSIMKAINEKPKRPNIIEIKEEIAASFSKMIEDIYNSINDDSSEDW